VDLPDDLRCLEEEHWGDREAESLGRLQVNDQLEGGGLLHGQVGGLGTFEDLVHRARGAAPDFRQAHAVGHDKARHGFVYIYAE
jgi:hypothetical protein